MARAHTPTHTPKTKIQNPGNHPRTLEVLNGRLERGNLGLQAIALGLSTVALAAVRLCPAVIRGRAGSRLRRGGSVEASRLCRRIQVPLGSAEARFGVSPCRPLHFQQRFRLDQRSLRGLMTRK